MNLLFLVMMNSLIPNPVITRNSLALATFNIFDVFVVSELKRVNSILEDATFHSPWRLLQPKIAFKFQEIFHKTKGFSRCTELLMRTNCL